MSYDEYLESKRRIENVLKRRLLMGVVVIVLLLFVMFVLTSIMF